MARRKRGRPINGWVNLNKPYDITSTQALGKLKRLVDPQKAGHAGTLDPLATGVLPVALGEATKTIAFAQDTIKTYTFTVTWREQRSTDDMEGEVIKTSDKRPTSDEIQKLLPQFIGGIEQIPPAFSAIKIDGQRAYDLARDAQAPELKPRSVYIESLELKEYDTDTASFEMLCGPGTYVRSLARDMAIELGTVGYISKLCRTQVGPFTIENAISLDKLAEIVDGISSDDFLMPLETVLDDIPALVLSAEEMRKVRNGQDLSFISKADFARLEHEGLGLKDLQEVLLRAPDKTPLAMAENKGPEIKPVRVFNL